MSVQRRFPDQKVDLMLDDFAEERERAFLFGDSEAQFEPTPAEQALSDCDILRVECLAMLPDKPYGPPYG